MPNRFFGETFDPALGSQARSLTIDRQFVSLEAAFDAVQAELDALSLIGTFLGLPDTPSSFSSAALKVLRVNAAASAIEFVSPGKVTITSIGGTSHTIEAANAGALLTFTNASAVTVTAPPHAADPIEVGTVLVVVQWGAGTVTIAAGAGVTLRATDAMVSTRDQFSQLTLMKTGENEWLIGGDRA